MSDLTTVAKVWRGVAAPTLCVFVVSVPATAYADDCSYTSPTDCYDQIMIALLVIGALALLVFVGWELLAGAATIEAAAVLAAEVDAAAAAEVTAGAQQLILGTGNAILEGEGPEAFGPAKYLAESAEGRAILRRAAEIVARMMMNGQWNSAQFAALQSMLQIFQVFGG